MAGNVFDFELRADDQVSGALKDISDQVKGLQPELDKTGEGLKLGGQETQDGLTDINASFQSLSRFAKDNVQLIGDMVPPLRNFLGNAGRLGGVAAKFGLAGGAAYVAGKGIQVLGGGMMDAADDAYRLQVAAENAGMSVQDFTRLSGAMRLLGSDSDSARGSVEGLYKTFNDALQGRNSAALAIMNQINTPIVRKADGTADVLKTVEKLAQAMPRLSPQNQKTVADALGLDANGLQLLREGARLKALLTKSDEVGLTVDPKINADLVDLNRSITDVSASWDGLKQRVKQKLAGAMVSDGSVKDGLKGVGDVLQHPTDPIAWNQALGNLRGNESDWLRRAQKDKKFFNTLPADDQLNVITGQMNESLRQKLRGQYGVADQASLLAGDMQAITREPASTVQAPPVGQKVDPAAASVRNNNPWNLNYAKQAGAVPAGRFAHFLTPELGVEAADRQLQLYATGKSKNVSRPLNTLNDIIHTASPRSDGNDPEAMTRRASEQLGVKPNQSLNLTDPQMRSRVLSALFNQEGNNPFSAEQIEKIISKRDARYGTSQPAPQLQQPVVPLRPEPEMRRDSPPGELAKNEPQPAQQPPLASAPAPALVTPAPGAKKGDSAEQIARAITDALKEHGVKLEVTFVNPANGSRQTMTATGGKVSTAMPFPG